MDMYYLCMMYKNYSSLGILLIKYNEEGNHILNEIFNNISYLIKTCLCVNCLQDDFSLWSVLFPVGSIPFD